MKLVIAKPSPFARKARVALIEKGIPFEAVIDLPWNPVAEGSGFNPLGKIPILVLDHGKVVHDSRVIVEYLETLDRPPRLIPSDPSLRVAHKQIEATTDGVCDAVVLIVLERSRACALQSGDWIERQMLKVEAGTQALASELGSRQWFIGLEFGLADTAVGCMHEVDWRSRHPNLVAFAQTHIRPTVVPGDGSRAAADRRSTVSRPGGAAPVVVTGVAATPRRTAEASRAP